MFGRWVRTTDQANACETECESPEAGMQPLQTASNKYVLNHLMCRKKFNLLAWQGNLFEPTTARFRAETRGQQQRECHWNGANQGDCFN